MRQMVPAIFCGEAFLLLRKTQFHVANVLVSHLCFLPRDHDVSFCYMAVSILLLEGIDKISSPISGTIVSRYLGVQNCCSLQALEVSECHHLMSWHHWIPLHPGIQLVSGHLCCMQAGTLDRSVPGAFSQHHLQCI